MKTENYSRSNTDSTQNMLTLFKHGVRVFGTKEKFENWLGKENFFFDRKAPIVFLDTNDGMKFIDDRLTGMEYGDNV